jgi:hypothetical protein
LLLQIVLWYSLIRLTETVSILFKESGKRNGNNN